MILCPVCAERQPHTGHLCARCAGRLRRDLADLAELWPLLPGLAVPGPRGRGARQLGKEPPLPVVLPILDLLAPHSPAVHTITGWTRVVVDERRLSAVPALIEQCLALLTRHADWLCGHDAIDEISRELHEAAWTVRHVCGDLPDPPLASCPEVYDDQPCRGVLRILATGDVRCTWCAALWTAQDLPHLLRAIKPTARIPISRAQACARYGIAPDTLRQWIRRGHVRTYGAERQDVDLLDVLTRLDPRRHANVR